MKRLSRLCKPSVVLLFQIALSVRVPALDEAAATASRPNIILLIADDMAWDDCGAYGHKTVRTPNIDKLASEGMRFTRAFLTASSCSPSRSSMITGRYPHSTGAQQLHWPLPPDQITFVELLKKAGYWTAAAGKWHLGEAVKDRFDLVIEANPAGFRLGHAAGQPAPPADASGKSGAGQWVSTLQTRPKGKPFFLWLAAFDPHRDYEEGIIPNPHRPEDVVGAAVPARCAGDPQGPGFVLRRDYATRSLCGRGSWRNWIDRENVTTPWFSSLAIMAGRFHAPKRPSTIAESKLLGSCVGQSTSSQAASVTAW